MACRRDPVIGLSLNRPELTICLRILKYSGFLFNGSCTLPEHDYESHLYLGSHPTILRGTIGTRALLPRVGSMFFKSVAAPKVSRPSSNYRLNPIARSQPTNYKKRGAAHRPYRPEEESITLNASPLVPPVGVEPTCPYGQQILSLPRMPIPSQRLIALTYRFFKVLI